MREPCMLNRLSLLIALVMLALAGATALAGASPAKPSPVTATAPAEADERAGPVTATVVPQQAWANPGGDIVLAVIMQHQPGWHTWPSKEQKGLLADALSKEVIAELALTSIGVATKPAWIESIGETQYPQPHPATVSNPGDGPLTIRVPTYEDRAFAFIPLLVSGSAPEGKQTVEVTVYFQTCNDKTCQQPETVVIPVEIEIAPLNSPKLMPGPDKATDIFNSWQPQRIIDLRAGKGVAGAKIDFDVFGLQFSIDPRGAAGLALLLLIAFVGGFLLNLTPCVLPVIPLKIMSLSSSAGNPGKCFYLGAVMSLGVVFFWLALGVMILTISGFTAISSLFSYPAVIIGIGVFILAMALGMFGFFTVSLPQAVYLFNPKQETTVGSFIYGNLTAILSTPCTAPLMGTAAAWAATSKNPVMVLSVFGAIGAGMALPYLVLSANPKWLANVPRTGPASELVKQVMGGLMFAVSLFFLGNGLLGLSPSLKWIGPVMWWSIAIVATASALFMFARALRLSASGVMRTTIAILAAILIIGPGVLAVNMTRKDPIPWEEYSAEALQHHITSGEVVVLDFTAEWCLNCKALEQTVLRTRDVVAALNSKGVTPMKADVTAKSAAGWAKLAELKQVGIPLLAVINGGQPGTQPGGEVVFMSNAYTPQQVLDAIKQARGPAGAAANP